MQPDDQHVETREENRIPNVLARAGGVLAAGLGLVVLLGWVLGLPLLSSLEPRWIPMAPSSALFFVLFGTAIFFSARSPLGRGAYRMGMVIGSTGALVALLLFCLSWMGIRLEAEHIGIPIAGHVNRAPIGHMSPVTALCFALTGLSLVTALSSSSARPWRAMAGFWLACLIVFASIIFLLAYLFGTPLPYGGQFVPPALTTSLAFAALGMALLAFTGPRAWAPDERIDAATLRASRSFILVFALVAAGLVAFGYVHFHDHEQHYRTEVERQLSAVAELKAGELAAWRAERLADATVLFRSAVFAALVRRALGNPKDLEAQEQLHGWLRQVREAYRYEHVSLMDTQGVARISIPDRPLPANAPEHAREALRSGQIAFLDFHRDAPGAAIHLSILIPIVGAKDGDRPLGVVVLDIDPSQYLYPFIERWPTRSRTAETLLVRRDGNDVLFLNELRFQKNTALSLRIPLDNIAVPAVKAALEQGGIVEGVDHRGVPVIAAMRAVPGSPWFLIARVDTAEALDPITERLWLMISLIGALLLAAGTAVGLVWRHQRVRHYKERLRAAEALSASATRYRVVTQTATDAIVTADTTGMIVDWNSGAERMFGYTETGIIGQPLTLLMPQRYRDGHLQSMKRVQANGERHVGGKTVELHGLTKAGNEFPLELSLSEWETSEGRFFTGIIRDITERKQAEELNRQQQEKLQLTSRLVTVGEMASTLAHEINQPLAAIANYIMGCVRRLRAGNWDPQEILAALEKAGVQAERAGRIIQRVRELVRKREPQRAAIDINSMIANAVSLIEINAEKNNVQLERAPELPAAYADEVMLEPAILNLTRNGIESMQQAPPVQRVRELVRKHEPQRAARDINSVIANAVSMIEINAKENNVQLKLELAPELPAAYADEVMLEQAILNLTRNGIESMQQAPRDERELTIRSRLNQDGAIEIEIADIGCGLPEALVRNPFEPFFTTKPDGLGMGLSICRSIMDWHNGRLWATRNPGRGSTFHLTLPVRQT